MLLASFHSKEPGTSLGGTHPSGSVSVWGHVDPSSSLLQYPFLQSSPLGMLRAHTRCLPFFLPRGCYRTLLGSPWHLGARACSTAGSCQERCCWHGALLGSVRYCLCGRWKASQEQRRSNRELIFCEEIFVIWPCFHQVTPYPNEKRFVKTLPLPKSYS